jgi:hypothetical protein
MQPPEGWPPTSVLGQEPRRFIPAAQRWNNHLELSAERRKANNVDGPSAAADSGGGTGRDDGDFAASRGRVERSC